MSLFSYPLHQSLSRLICQAGKLPAVMHAPHPRAPPPSQSKNVHAYAPKNKYTKQTKHLTRTPGCCVKNQKLLCISKYFVMPAGHTHSLKPARCVSNRFLHQRSKKKFQQSTLRSICYKISCMILTVQSHIVESRSPTYMSAVASAVNLPRWLLRRSHET